VWAAAPPETKQNLDENSFVKNDVFQIISKKIEQFNNSSSLINGSLEKLTEAIAEQGVKIDSQDNQINASELQSEENKKIIKKLSSDIETLSLITDYFDWVIEKFTNDFSKQKREIDDQTDQHNALEDQVQKVQAVLKEAILSIKQHEAAIKKSSINIQKLNGITKDINENLEGLNSTISDIKKKIIGLEKNISEGKKHTDLNINAIKEEAKHQNQNLNRTIYKRTILFVFAFVVILILIFVVYFIAAKKLLESTIALEQKITTAKETIETEYLKTDTVLTDLIEKQLEVFKLPVSPESVENEPDHSLPLQVGQEIHRMRKRISNMPEDTKGLGALKNSLNRLEEKFNAKGYEIINLMGKPYVDGLSVKARFVPSDELNPGEDIITKIIIPQINFDGVLIQAANVEVSTGD